jgi:CubicO group peptidase (beta-lactamase class C family)
MACLLAGIAISPASANGLVPFPPQPATTSYPTHEWPEVSAGDPLRRTMTQMLAKAFEGNRPEALAHTRAVLVVWGGRIIAERYSPGITRSTRLQSWSMAKSILHVALGIASAEGLVDPKAPAPVPEWQSPADPRHGITLLHLARMTDGLGFTEDYLRPEAGALQMLFGAGRLDVGRFAAMTRLAHTPGSSWSYSSGSANIISRVLRDRLGGMKAYRAFLATRLFKPTGMKSAVPEFDASGTWIGSSYIHATARDFARFGLLCLRGGLWDGHQLIPSSWIDLGRTPTQVSKGEYGALFWLNARNPESGTPSISSRMPEDLFMARGFGGQFIAIIPSRDAVVVMLNATYAEDPKPIIDVVANIIDALSH